MKFNPRKIKKTLDYLPRWAWYLGSLFMAGPFGPLVVYLVFHVLNKMIEDCEEEPRRTADACGASDVYQDEECIVMDEDEVNRRWQQTQANAHRAQEQTFGEEDGVQEDSVQEVIRSGREALVSIRRANDLIPDPLLSAQIDSIEGSCAQILSILEQRPQLLAQLRTFLRYYLPATLRLLNARARLENTANTPKAREVKARISEALGVIDKAFLKQVEALDEYRFIDLESEMDALADMLRADGLISEEDDAKGDPFADVLSARRGTTAGGR